MDDPRYKAQAAALLEPVYLRKSKWPELTRALEAQLEAEESPERKKELLRRLAQLHEVQLEDLETGPRDLRASVPRGAFGRPVLGRPGSPVRACSAARSAWPRSTRPTSTRSGLEDETGVRLAVIAAQIRDQFGRNFERSSALYQRALAVDRPPRAVADALEDVLCAGAQRRAAHVLPRPGRRRRRRRVVSLVCTSWPRCSSSSCAMRTLPSACTRSCSRSWRAIPCPWRHSTACWRKPRPGRLWPSTFSTRSIALANAAAAAQLKLRLAKLYEEHLDDVNLAIDTYEDVTRLEPNNR